MCFGCFSSSGVKEELNSRLVSDDISLHKENQQVNINNSLEPYQSPLPPSSPSNNNNNSSSTITNNNYNNNNNYQSSLNSPSNNNNNNNNNNEKKYFIDNSSLPIPEKSENTSYTGWLFYKTGAVIPTFEKNFFVLEDGYLYIYNKPKRSASSNEDLVENPICLIGCVISKVALTDRPYCIEIEKKLFIDARTSATQIAWINALIEEIDTVSFDYLTSGKPSAKDELALWFGKLLGRKQNCVTILQQKFVVTKHFMKAGFHRSHERIMQVDANGEKIIWGSNDGKDKHGSKDDNKSINLSTIIEVVPGASTQALSNITNPTRIGACFTVYSEDRSLDVEMQDVATKNLWVTNLNEICFVNKVIDAMNQTMIPQRGVARRPSVIQRKAALKEQLAKNTVGK